MPRIELDWTEAGVPVSRRHGDPFYSRRDGLSESRHVFLAGNGLPGRFRPGFTIAELGFGTGLNALAAWQAWDDAGMDGALDFTSFEAAPMAAPDMRRALATWPQEDIARRADRLLAVWNGRGGAYDLGSLRLAVIEGDANDTLPDWRGAADAWFLDGFSPARNPDMWSDDLMAAVAAHTRPGGTFATYSAAGHVRRALAAAGFAVERRPGFAGKRHMTCGAL